MKLGTAWYGFGDLTPSNYFETVAALGFKYVEVPLYNNSLREWYKNQEDTQRVFEAAQAAGVKIVSGVEDANISGQLIDKQISRDGVDLGLAQARRAIDIGAFLGVEVIRLTEPDFIEPEQLHLAETYLQAHGEAYATLGDYAAEFGLRVVIENYGLTSKQINTVLDTANHSAVGTLYDPCNYYRHGEDPLTALKNLGQRIYYCHLKDAYIPYPACRPDSLPMATSGLMKPYWWIRPLGEGNIDWGPILSELSTFYKGYLCLEHDIRDNVVRGTKSGMAYVRSVATAQGFEIEI